MGLEGRDGGNGAGAVLAVHGAGVVAQFLQPGLHGLNILALAALAKGTGGDAPGGGGGRGGGAAGVARQQLLNLLKGDGAGLAVGGQSVGLLKDDHGRLRGGAESAVHRAGEEAQVGQGLLQQLDPAALAAVDQLGIVAAEKALRTAGGAAAAAGRAAAAAGGAAASVRQGVQAGQGGISGHAVHLQPVVLLKLAYGLLCGGAKLAVGPAGRIAKADQRLLHLPYGLALVAIAQGGIAGGQRARRKQHQRRHRGDQTKNSPLGHVESLPFGIADSLRWTV